MFTMVDCLSRQALPNRCSNTTYNIAIILIILKDAESASSQEEGNPPYEGHWD